ncbi:MAG: hypothetical protein LC802_11690 [Acidobacteria bacterium]|nr:hypothetical protein [Acidobacteriota bacterium]
MSDYLWDKTGDGDAEVERLEELLGGFGHRPRALELPAAEAAPPPRVSLLQSRRFRPALLAAAAALLLMMLAGALVVLRQEGGTDSGGQAAGNNSKDTPPKREVAAPREEFTPPGEPEKREERAGRGGAPVDELAPPDFRRATLNGRQQQRSPGARDAGSNQGPRRVVKAQAPGVAAQKESTAPPSPERQAAKERLVYALRLASAKLNEVQRMTSGEETPRRAPQERNRTR